MDQNRQTSQVKTRQHRGWIFSAAVLLGFGWWVAHWLPDPLFDKPTSHILLSQEGKLLGAKIAQDQQWRFPPLRELPEKYKKSVLLFEDKRFRYHPGIDPFALGRAFYLNYKHKRVVSGGSTLTMQVVRLARSNPNRTYVEKIVEIFLALRLELTHSKDEIFSLYASHAPFGGNVVGLEAASWRYFGRPPHLLSWAESTLLAVLPNSPSLIHPGRNRQKLKNKRDRLLEKLHQKGEIDNLTMKLAMEESLPDKPHPLPRLAPHYLETLIAKNKSDGYRTKSTMKWATQKAVHQIVSRHSKTLQSLKIDNAAALVIDNENMSVVAYVGNSRHHGLDESGTAIDLIHRPRSTGSILKPLLYAAMLQEGEILPTTLVPDLPTQYGSFIPQNYDKRFRGAVPAHMALAQSLNVPAVRMLRRYGVPRFADYLKSIGMTTLHRPPDHYGLALILGGAEGTLWELTSIYANFSSLAKTQLKNVDFEFHEPATHVNQGANKKYVPLVTPGSAWLTLKALLDVTRPGTDGYWEEFSSSKKIAWKTGTSYGHRDAWAIGSDARYTVGIWVGNANGEGRPEIIGGTAAAPILFDIFSHLGPGRWFDKPNVHIKDVAVCKNDGYLPFGNCETEFQMAPVASHFDKVSPHQKIVHLDEGKKWRVHGKCESVSRMQHQSWFVLPPGQEYYYRKSSSDYELVPPYRDDCRSHAQEKHRSPIQFLYPSAGSKVYIPMDLAEEKGRTVFEVAHRQPRATIFWHLDGDYLGKTGTFHQQALDITPGHHEITVVDHEGNYATRKFEILNKNNAL